MKYNASLLRSAREEWSDWLEEPDQPHFGKEADVRRWIENRPPLHAFDALVGVIDVMQDEIDLLNCKLEESEAERKRAVALLTRRF